MASSTGVLPFLKGANFSHNNFHGECFPKTIDQMVGLRWLKLNDTKLDWVPEEFAAFEKLEKLDLSHNNLTSLYGELICLKNLKYLCCRRNKILSENVPVEIFKIDALTVLDLSHNNLKVIPKSLDCCKSLSILNLSHNEISNIHEQLFRNLTELKHLNLSDNLLETIPPSIGRLSKLTHLLLDKNPLRGSKLTQIEKLKTLESLSLANTQRNSDNLLPVSIGELTNLVELNLSTNDIAKVPYDLCNLKLLRRLDISENQIEKLPDDFGTWWPDLTSLSLSGNKLTELPSSLCKLCNLKRLYLNDNRLTFEGLPAAIGKLYQLEIFMAARNELELIPESIFRCGKLRKLILTSNKLITLPDTIHLLYDLEVLDLSNNSDLIMPPKPISDSAKNTEFYNIDFSLNTQLRLAGDPNMSKLPAPMTNAIKDPIARKLRLRRRAKEDVDQQKNQAKVLKGMEDLVKEKESLANNQSDFLEPDLKPKRWDEILERPPIDYSDFFDETTGQIQGLTIWEIENFCPVLMDASLHGKFFDADCYIILSTHVDENLSLNWKIFYWIGTEASLDKKACSAIHAVGLRNHLNAHCRTIREEQGEETDEFLSLFPDGIDYVRGARTSSGFYTFEEAEYPHKMFRLHEVAEKTRQLHLETVKLSSNSLDSRLVFLIDVGSKIFVWNGMRSKNTTRQKARLFGEKLNKEERKNKSELVFCEQGDEPSELLTELGLTDPLPKIPFKTVDLQDDFEPDSFVPFNPVLYHISIGVGYIELLQIDYKPGYLLTKYLVANNVFILDCITDLFVWLGRRSSKLARNAALKLAQELFSMIKRPEFASITSCLQGTESQLFKSKFRDWDDVIAVDYTRTAESVSKTGADLSKWMSAQQVKIDLASLFAPMPEPLTEEHAQMLIEDWNDELEVIDTYILDKTKRFMVNGYVVNGGFVELPKSEFGHFYTDDCYVFLCRYYIPMDESESSEDKPIEEDSEKRLTNGVSSIQNGDAGSSPQEENLKFVVYFWQGRHASKMGWLTFTFSLQKKFEALFGNKLEVIQMHQQQENIKFLSHFRKKFIIHRGKRKSGLPHKSTSLYHLRSNRNPLTIRCIEIEPNASLLNSGFCYLLRRTTQPSNEHIAEGDNSENHKSETCSKIYVWVGSKCLESESRLAEDIAKTKFSIDCVQLSVIVIQEGDEPDEFWTSLGGRQQYETNASFMHHNRLFKCSNDKGYFNISERCSDFCQDDLSDDDIMILDNGTQVFLWIGPKSSEVEVKLAYKSAQVYVQNLRLKDPNPRQLMLTFKGKESRKFTKCFHAWSQYKVLQDPRP